MSEVPVRLMLSLHYTVFPAPYLIATAFLGEEQSPLGVERRESNGSEC
jgi:hypothetical protein